MIDFPLGSDRFEHDFGIRALAPGQLILERTSAYPDQIRLKRKLLREDPANYLQFLPESHDACRDAADFLKPLVDSLRCDESFPSDGELAAEESPGYRPLLRLAKSIQEDLVILSGDPQTGHAIVAGVVCFPSGWSIADKIGMSIDATHQPVPDYQAVLAAATNRLLSRLKVGRSVWRMNWGVRCCGQLDQSPKHERLLQDQLARITSENAGQQCFFRVERQTLSRLPVTQAILFTIHTRQCPLQALTRPQRQRLLRVLESCPQATLAYKGIAGMRDPLLQYLANSLDSNR